jgi:hypothetical protein
MNDPAETRSWLFEDWPGCSHVNCVVNGPNKGKLTNGDCNCITGANRSQLRLLDRKLKQYLDELEK